ncbi:MAG: peptidoglycan editing factor PgeF [Methylobacteriaceae bacterium]|nr:peptidoglycan editing factor PgeF [Methylobacteriaceae bacterium]
MTPPIIESPLLAGAGVAHAFFTREGGVSTGVYATLNGGVGSRDERAHVLENRRRMARALGVADDALLVPFQIHSADAIAVDAKWDVDHRPRCDGIVTATRGLALGVTGADCGVTLYCDPEAQVIGAAHSGWKGALNGVLEATIEAMERLGARRERIACALGPTIAQTSYEVGPEFRRAFLDVDAGNDRFFAPSPKPGHAMFDLPGFIAMRLTRAGVGRFENLGLDTYADETRFYSYRRTTHRAEPDYGRLVAAVALP